MKTQLVIAITATDTGVGKTTVTRGLLRALIDHGKKPFPLKWVETGCSTDTPSDRDALAAAANIESRFHDVGPIRLAIPAAPTVAARHEGRVLAQIDYKLSLETAKHHGELVIVEGAGGALVPMTQEANFADLCVALQVQCAVIVARTTLGTINHTALTIEALQHRKIRILAVVLNESTATTDNSGSCDELKRLYPDLVLGPLPWLPSSTDDQLASAVTECGLTARVMSVAAE